MKTILKTGLLLLTFGISQFTWAQDKSIKTFIKSHKSNPDATYLIARSGEDFNFNTNGMSGIMDLLGNIGSVKMINLKASTAINTDFKQLKSKLNQRYETMINLTDNNGGISVFTDEDNGYLYALIQGDNEIIVVSLESQQ